MNKVKKNILFLALAVALSSSGESKAGVYFNDFTGGQGDFTIANTVGGATNGWAANSTCPASILPGHSFPDNLRWGTFTDCGNYGLGTTSSTASTPVLTIPGVSCELSFNYLLQFAEGPTWDDADVEVQGGATLASYTDGTLTSGPAWKLLGGLNLPSGTYRIDFIGAVTDFTLNTGAGFHIDDVEVDCPFVDGPDGPVPAVGSWGVLAMIALLLVASLLHFRRRVEQL